MKDQSKSLKEEKEKKLIRNYFDNKKDGVVIEIGANEPVSMTSQSWHLENKLGWISVLVEPNPELAEKARKLRPHSIVYECACVSSDDMGEISFFIPIENEIEIHSHAAIGKNIDDHAYSTHRMIQVKSKTLNTIIEECGLTTIDLLSIDVEGSELEVLKGLDLKKYRPNLILLEDKHVYLTKHRLLKKSGYRLVKRTGFNCWYIPKGSKRPEQTLKEKITLFKRLYLSIWWKKAKLAVRKRNTTHFH